MLNGWFLWFIMIWVIIMVILFAIGGFFMFRKFLKKIPKADGKSDMDWQEYYIGETKNLWGESEKAFLTDLVEPVPELFREVARQTISGKIGELALKENATSINQSLVIRGYILATPKRDHKFLRKKLAERKIDTTDYEHLFT